MFEKCDAIWQNQASDTLPVQPFLSAAEVWKGCTGKVSDAWFCQIASQIMFHVANGLNVEAKKKCYTDNHDPITWLTIITIIYYFVETWSKRTVQLFSHF